MYRISYVYIATLTSIIQKTLLVFCRQLRNRIRSYSYDLLISHWYLHTCSPLLRNLPWTTPSGAVHNTVMDVCLLDFGRSALQEENMMVRVCLTQI